MEPRPPCFITPFFSKVLTPSMSYFQEQFHKLELNKIAARWPAKAVA